MRRRFLFLCLVLSATAPASAAERPSFDCRTARSAREVAVCMVPRLARGDRAVADAYAAAKARLSPAGRAALVEDQRRFVETIEFGFERDVFGKAEPADVPATVRRALKTEPRTFDDLAGILETRARYLAGTRPPAGRFDGLWYADDTSFDLERRPDGTYRGRFYWEVYGYPRDHCGFTAVFRREGATLVAESQEGDDDFAQGEGRLILALEHDTLSLRNVAEDKRACGRDAELKRTLFRAGEGEK